MQGQGKLESVAPQSGRAALFLAGGLAVAASALLALAPHERASEVAAPFLVAFAGLGVFALLAVSAGLLRWRGRAGAKNLAGFIADSDPDAVAAVDAAGAVIYANAAYRALCGAPERSSVLSPERLMRGPREVGEAVYRLAQAAREFRAHAEELPGENESGGSRRVATRPLRLPGARSASLWTIADIGAADHRDGAPAERAARVAGLLDAAPAGAFSADRDGKLLYMNAALADWTGRDLREIEAGEISLGALLAPEAVAAMNAGAGAPGEAKILSFEAALTRRDGASLPARILHRVAFDAEGVASPSQSLVFLLEKTRAAAPDAPAPAGEPYFARMFEAAPIAIAKLGPDGAIARANPAFLRLAPGAAPAEGGAPGSVYAAVAGRDRAPLEAALAAAARPQAEAACLDVTLAGDRPARFFICAPQEGDAGATIFALDATEQRTLETNFLQSQKMQAIGQLAGGVAHDFNNVLTAIIGFSDLLLANHRATDPSFRDIMQIKQNAIRAAGLVRQLLAFSRRQTLRPQVLQLGDVLADLQIMMRRLVGEKIHLELRHGRDLWPVKADLNQFEQVIVNLIVNARDAMPDGGEILIRTRNVSALERGAFDDAPLADADYVAIEVEDGGHGVAPDVRDKIFEPFFTTKEVGKGTGLGLAMVYGIVKQTGGSVFCLSPPGKGATFTVLLPRHTPEPAEAVASVEKAKPAADLTGRGTILLVEDEEAVRAFGARALASRGYSVLEAGSGLEALEIVDRNPGRIDLVVSDVVMPEMDGPTMFGELRKRGVAAKVIFVSGYAEEAFAKNLPDGGDFAFLPKPFTLKQLIEAVKGAAAGL